MRKLVLPLFALALSLGASGCYIDDDYCCDDTEIIRFENYANSAFDNFIDGEFVGQVPPDGALEVEGDFEGIRTFESRTPGGSIVCGPEDFRIYDGELFVLELDSSCDFKVKSQGKKPPKQ